MGDSVWFWQSMVSPHITGLACALAAEGVAVTYVAERPMSPGRIALGWDVQALKDVDLHFTPSRRSMARLVDSAPEQSIHICQGLWRNGIVGRAQSRLARRNLRQWVIIEKVDDAGPWGLAKRVAYRGLLKRRARTLEGVLAIGHGTKCWLIDRGSGAENIFPFAYFLADARNKVTPSIARTPRFQFIFVGQLVATKRLELLIDALADLSASEVELVVVGSGPLETGIRPYAVERLGDRVRWIGRLSRQDTLAAIAQADCLVLPSQHDGWGAVVSEAMIAGTPAIASDACGSAGVVRASGFGAVFPAGDCAALLGALRRIVNEGRGGLEQREALAMWARRLGAEAGARYLREILRYRESGGPRPSPPWEEVGSESP